MLIVPTSTDAPIYHFPFATIGLIATSIVASVLAWLNPDQAAGYLLEWGTFRPHQWLTSIFIHAGIVHLIFNCLFLWIFGLVVEGKVGWLRMLAISLGIGVFQCAMEQMVTLGFEEGSSCGISSVLFGLMAIAMIWAPANQIEVTLVAAVRLTAFHRTFEVPVSGMVGFYILVDVIFVAMNPSLISSAMLHLMGAVLGLAFGLVALKWGWVDCENWDIFSVWKGDHNMSPEGLEQLNQTSKERIAERKAAKQQFHENSIEQINGLLTDGNVDTAWQAHLRLSRKSEGWQLPPDLMMKMITEFHRQERFVDSIPIMVAYVAEERPQVDAVRVKLAQILIAKQKRPAQALAVLSKVQVRGLQPTMRTLYDQLKSHADRLTQDGVLEVTEDW